MRTALATRRAPRGVEALTVDLFDTLVVRRTGSPNASIRHLAARLASTPGPLAGLPPERIAEARRHAEVALVAERTLDSSVDLIDIWSRTLEMLDLPAGDAAAMAGAEHTFERDVLVNVPGAAEAAMRTAGTDRYTVLSDTFLSSEEIDGLLRSAGVRPSPQRVLASSELGAAKRTRSAYAAAAATLGVQGSQLLHVGNDYPADVRAAATTGVQVAPRYDGNLTRYELLLDGHSNLGSLLAGACRIARLSRPELSPDDQVRYDIAADVGAPLVISWLIQILHRARELGVEELYFVTRDGNLLRDVAEILAKSMDYSVACRLIAGSRQSYVGPAAARNPARWLPLLFQGRRDIQDLEVADMLARLGIEVAPDDPIRGEVDIVSAVATRPDLLAACATAQRPKRDLVVQYLHQNDIGRRPYALVELGAYGTVYTAFWELAEAANIQTPVTAFYWGLEKNRRLEAPVRPEPYLYDVERGDSEHRLPNAATFLESVCTAEHGSVLEFERRGERVEPLFGPAPEAQRLWGRDLVWEAVLDVARTLRFDAAPIDLSEDLRPAVAQNFHAFWFTPSADEAKVWGSFPFEDGWASAPTFKALATPIVLGDLIKTPMSGWIGGSHRNTWFPGRFSQSAAVTRVLARNAMRVGRRVRVRQRIERLRQ